jgi:hypothetical protein
LALSVLLAEDGNEGLMDTLKEVLALVGALAGTITALISLYARFLDKEKQARESNKVQKEEQSGIVAPGPTALDVVEEAEDYRESRFNAKKIEQVSSLVKGPALAMLVVGFLGLGFNLVVAGFGFVDQFVTPLGLTSREQMVTDRSTQAKGETNKESAERERGNAVMTFFMLLSFSVACGMAIWAGFSMIDMRSYSLSMAGSFAIMPGACFCCLAGIPVGIWSLTVLLKPEVRAAFR